MKEDPLYQDCLTAARKLIAENEWRLLDVQGLADKICEAVESENNSSESRLRTQGVNVYNPVLYAACRGDEGQDRQEQGYRELHRLLYKVACSRRPKMAEEATAKALLYVFEKLHQCRSPVTFMAFANNWLRAAITDLDRRRGEDPLPPKTITDMGQEEDSLSAVMGAVHGMPEQRLAAWQNELVRKATARCLLQAIGRLNSEFRRKVIVLKYFASWSDEQIGEHLEKSPNNVRVTRSRGMKQLREDQGLRQCLEEAGER